MNSRRRVHLVTMLPILGCILLFCLGYAIHRANWSARNQATQKWEERLRLADEKRAREVERLGRDLQEGRTSQEEWLKAAGESGNAWEREASSAGEERMNAGLSTSWQKVAFFAMGAPLLLPLLLIIRVLWHIRARMLLNELRLRGYDFLTIHDALWLALIMPRRAFTMPSASDYLTVPRSTPDIRGLIAFLRQKR